MKLRRKLNTVERSRSHKRDRRRDRVDTPPTVALCGYTNSGKSSLLNALCDVKSSSVQDELFHTLDPLTRKLLLPQGGDARIIDTVGFIQKLPTELVAAFKSTLEEVIDADLVLHIVDISSELAVAQTVAVEETLSSLVAKENKGDKVFTMPRQITVWNKIDNFSNVEKRVEVEESLKKQKEMTFLVSAKTGEGLSELRKGIRAALAEKMLQRVELKGIPIDQAGKLVGEFRRCGVVENEAWDEDAVDVVAKLPKGVCERSDVARFKT